MATQRVSRPEKGFPGLSTRNDSQAKISFAFQFRCPEKLSTLNVQPIPEGPG
jgi:hypothetical protein